MPKLGSLRSEMYLRELEEKYHNEKDPIKKAYYGENLRSYKKNRIKKAKD